MSSLGEQKLPIVAWGEGGCSNIGAFYRNFLGEIASHGFLIVAVGPPQQPQPPANPGAPGAIAENGRKDSKYYHRLDTSKVAVMGHSCGGIQALAVAADPRVKLVIN